MSTTTATATVATVRTRRIVRALAAGTWSALQTYGALVMASYGVVVTDDTSASGEAS